jgi:hypothetical protein
VTLLSLETEEGFAPPVLWTKPDRRIEFVGDSITAVSNLHRPSGGNVQHLSTAVSKLR